MLVPFAALSATFGATLGLLGVGAPLFLRARGMPLAHVGLIQLIYIPIGTTFLWAPVLDRVRLPGLPHRTGWIVAMQAFAVVLLLVLSTSEGRPALALFALCLGISFALATMDAALEALVVETVAQACRPSVTTAKLVGASLGTAAGISLVTVFADKLSMPRAIATVAAFDAACLLPLLRFPEATRRLAPEQKQRSRPAYRRSLLRRAAVLGFYFAASLALASAPSLVLLDLKVPLSAVGLFSGPLGTTIGVVMMILSGSLMGRIVAHRLVLIFASGVAASSLALAGAIIIGSPWLGVAAGLLNLTCSSGLGVPVFNVIYRWAEGTQAATDYALLFGTAFLLSFPIRMASPMLAAALGWPGFFAACVPVFMVATLVLASAMRNTPCHDTPVEIAVAT